MKRITLMAAIITLFMLTAFALRLYLQTETRTGLELARFMPRGAIAYVEFRDLHSLLNQWLSSAAHQRYFQSATWQHFQRSRLYLRLNQRLDPIEAALGFDITTDRAAVLAGRRSALGIYNIGRLEAVFVTQMSRERALGSDLFKQRAAFQQRSTDGIVYYLRQGTSPKSRRKVEAGFAFAEGKLFVASSESLLRRTLATIKAASEDRLSPQIARLTESLVDFAPHDITVWLDQKQLNTDRYFRNYWIHRNPSELSNIESALIDLELTDEAFRERRWFALNETTRQPPPAINSLNELLRYAPASAQLVRVEGVESIGSLSRLAAETLLGRLPGQPFLPIAGRAPAQYVPSLPATGVRRFANLDERFNKDIDDPTSFSGSWPEGIQQPAAGSSHEATLLTRLASILQPAQPVEFLNVGEATRGKNRLFVFFNRALVIKLGQPDGFRQQEFEDALREEFAARYVVQGVPGHLQSKVAGEVHSLNQAMLDAGGAYAVRGDALILANRADYCRRIVGAYQESEAPAEPQAASLERFAQVRIQRGKASYTHLMEMLAVPKPTVGSNLVIDLFSDNIASLLQVVPELNNITVERLPAAPTLREEVIYRFE